MSQTWRDVVATLAGPDGSMRLIDPTGWEATFVAEVEVPGGLFRGRGDDEDDAWGRVAHALGDSMLCQSLEAAGWSEVDTVMDETTYIVARDPAGAVWAIGVAVRGGRRHRQIARDIASDARTFDRIAFIEPIDTRDAASVVAALEAGA